MAKYTGTVRYGATGDNVKKIQEALNASGNYNLTVDGVWGDKTDAAVKAYQQANGLAVDGIVGENTWASLLGSSKIETPSFEYGDFTYDEYKAPDPFNYADYKESDSVIEAGNKKTDSENALANLGDYTMSDEVIAAGKQKTDAENAVANYGDFSYSNDAMFDKIINKILNREKFSYDLNGDALYQQYKDKYIQQGKQAMQDTMGQAAAMTGGYGNSYAATAGNQAYQASLENLNDIIPELYQMAYDKYNQEGQDLYNQYSMLSDDRAFDYGMWSDKYNRLMSEREYYANNYNNLYGMDYGMYVDKYNRLAADRDYHANQYNAERNYDYSKYSDDRNFEYGKYSDDRSFGYNQYVNDRNFAYDKYSNDKSYAYQNHRDEIADKQWQAQFDEAVRMNDLSEEQFNWQKAQYQSSSDSGSGGSGGGSGSGGSGSGAGGGGTDDEHNETSDSGSVSNKIKQKAGSFKTNSALNDYLNGLVAEGEITKDQAIELYAANKNSEADLKDRKWTQVDDGGINWLWGVDNNAKVKDQYGNVYRLDDLVDALVKEGMSKKDAKEFVKKYN